MKKHVIILNGSGGTGKNTFADLCGDYARMKHISAVDLVKKSASILGWEGGKEDKDRKFLSDLKLLSIYYCDHPFKYILGQIAKFRESNYELLFIDVREPEEIQRLKDIGCTTVLLINSNVDPIITNMADANVLNYDYDHVIDNSRSFADLAEQAKQFVRSLRNS